MTPCPNMCKIAVLIFLKVMEAELVAKMNELIELCKESVVSLVSSRINTPPLGTGGKV